MSQECARLYIKVTDPSVWEKLFKLKLDKKFWLHSAKEIFGESLEKNSTEFILDGDFWMSSSALFSFVCDVHRVAGDDCAVFADFTDINVDPFNTCFAYTDTFYSREINNDMHFNVEINNVETWLRKARIRRTKDVLEYLSKFDGENFDFAKKQLESLKNQAEVAKTAVVSSSMNGLKFVVSGDLGHFSSRSKLKEYIESCGGKLTGSVSPKTNYLITDSPDSGTTKVERALELGIKIISEEEFLEMFGNPT